MQAMYQACYSAAIPRAGVTISTLVALCAAPVIVALLAPLVTKEHLTSTILVALVGTLSGTVLLIATGSHEATVEVAPLGVLFAFLAACGYAGFILCGRLISHSSHPLQVNTLAFAIGALILLLLSPSTGLALSYSAWDWLLIVYLGCIPTALAYGLFQIGIRSLTATMVSIITLCEPLTAALLAWLLFREELSWLGLLGAGLLLASLGILVFPSKRS
jgi:DME family drug/metabolite transporter